MEKVNTYITLFDKTLEDFVFSNERYTIILLSFCFWTFLYFISYLLTKHKQQSTKLNDTLNRSISTIYVLVAIFFSLYDITINQSKCVYNNTWFQDFAILMSFGYFIYDLIFSFYLGVMDNIRLFHHILVLFSEFEYFVMNTGGYLMVRWALYLETPSLFMHYRMILMNSKLKETELFKFTEDFYFLGYIVGRFSFVYFSIGYYAECEDNLKLTLIVTVLLYIQFFWIISKMIRIFRKRLQESKERKDYDVSLYWDTVNPEVLCLPYYLKEQKKSKSSMLD